MKQVPLSWVFRNTVLHDFFELKMIFFSKTGHHRVLLRARISRIPMKRVPISWFFGGT